MSRSGFTLVEVLIVIGILTLMTSFLVLYNRTSELQIVLLKEKASLIDALLRSKNLALGTLAGKTAGATVCGFGVHFEGAGYFLYRDLAADCQASDNGYSGDGSGEKLAGEIFNLPASVKFSRREAADVLFTPPMPDVFFDGLKAIGEILLVLSDAAEQTEVQVIVNSAGQISDD